MHAEADRRNRIEAMVEGGVDFAFYDALRKKVDSVVGPQVKKAVKNNSKLDAAISSYVNAKIDDMKQELSRDATA